MDNASKALIMAGGVLISLLVISLVIYSLNVYRNYGENASLLNRSSQDEAFNRFFEYSGGFDNKVYGFEAYNIIKKADDIKNRDDGDYISVDYPLVDWSSQGFGQIDENDLSKLSGDDSLLTKRYNYSYEYNGTGRHSGRIDHIVISN